MQHHDVASTLSQRCVNVRCLLGRYLVWTLVDLKEDLILLEDFPTFCLRDTAFVIFEALPGVMGNRGIILFIPGEQGAKV